MSARERKQTSLFLPSCMHMQGSVQYSRFWSACPRMLIFSLACAENEPMKNAELTANIMYRSGSEAYVQKVKNYHLNFRTFCSFQAIFRLCSGLSNPRLALVSWAIAWSPNVTNDCFETHRLDSRMLLCSPTPQALIKFHSLFRENCSSFLPVHLK